MSDQFTSAIAALERRLADAEKRADGIRSAINLLCEEAGMAPRYKAAASQSTDRIDADIKPDRFYGKKQSTAAREYLEMRRAQGHGPAKPREIFDALKQGGYRFEAKDDEVALVGLRALLRKNTVTFHRLPSGTYGLASWYPDAKRPKVSADEDDDEREGETAAPKGAAAPNTTAKHTPTFHGEGVKQNPERKAIKPDREVGHANKT